MKERIGQMDNIDQKDANLKEIARELYAQIEQMDSSKRALVMSQIVAVDAIRIFNQIGKFATADVLGCTYESMPDSWALAKELETWFYFYKKLKQHLRKRQRQRKKKNRQQKQKKKQRQQKRKRQQQRRKKK